MQSNRTLGLFLLVVVIAAAVIGWQMLGDDTLPSVPVNDREVEESLDVRQAKSVTVGGGIESDSSAAAEREAVPSADPAASDLPSIVGQVVSPSGAGMPDVAVVCLPGLGLNGGLRGFDFDDMNVFDPQAIMERLGGKASDRVATTTDAEGFFRIRSIGEAESVRLSVKARGYLVIDRRVERPTTEDVDVGVLALETSAIITGRVVDHVGEAVVGASVWRSDSEGSDLMAGLNISFPGSDAMEALRGGDRSVTDESGRFELAHLAAGEFSLRARHPDYSPALRTGLSVLAGHSVADILITMPRSGEIRGTVLGLPADTNSLRIMASQRKQAANDPTGGIMGMLGGASEMLEGIGFSYGERQCEIAADGAFVLRGLTADSTYRVWVAQQGRGFAGQGLCSKRVEAQTDAAAVTLQYEQGVNVTLVVVDSKTGSPVESMWVRDQLRGGGNLRDMLGGLDMGGSRQQSYPGGKVTVANLRPEAKQKLQLTIQAIGYGKFEQKDIVLPEIGSLDLGTVRLDPKPVLNVLVKNAYHGKPVRGANVSFSDEQGGGPMAGLARMGMGGRPTQSGRTDSEGRCALNAVIGEASQLTVTRKGFAPASVTIAAPEGLVQEQVVRLIEGGSVFVTVLDPDGKPVKDASVEHLTPEGSKDSRSTNASGIARFENLTPDLHDFRIGVAGRGGALQARFGNLLNRGGEDVGAPWQSVDVMDQEAAELSLRKSPTASLTGVVRENGVPLEGATVTFRKGQAGSGSQGSTDDAMNAMMGMFDAGGRRGSGRNRDTSDEDGVYTLSDLPSGNHSVLIRHKGRAMQDTVTVTLGDGENRFDIELSMTAIVGVVKDSSGKPVANAQVSVSIKRDGGNAEMRQASKMMADFMGGMGGMGGRSSAVRTNGQGEFELRGVAADVPLVISVRSKAFSPTLSEQTVALGQTKGPIQLTMSSAGRIEITVQKAQMFAAIRAKFLGDGSVDPVNTMLRGKKGALEGLQPGAWEVTFLTMGSRNAESAPKQVVTVTAGQTATVAF
jgi:protocatechuate 3,4-dioxygenase beta subunit